MKTKYICTDCAKEIPWNEVQRQNDIFCLECGGQNIEEIAGDLGNKKQAVQPPTIQCPYCNEVNFSWKINCSNCGKDLNVPKESSNLMACPYCSSTISKRAELCPKCQNTILKKCFVCKNKIRENSKKDCPECGDPHPFTKPQSLNPLLKPCPSCGFSLSERASQCPHCKTVILIPCKVCSAIISCWSQVCPKCGDPSPFDLQEKKQEQLSTEYKNNISGSTFSSKSFNQKREDLVTNSNNSSQKFSLTWFIFSFDGRIGRQSFWCAYPIILFLGLVSSVALELIKGSGNMNGLFIIVILTFLLLWPSISIQVKRWHDRNKSGNWILLNFIPILGFVWIVIELGFLKGTEGNNIYGADPLSK